MPTYTSLHEKWWPKLLLLLATPESAVWGIIYPGGCVCWHGSSLQIILSQRMNKFQLNIFFLYSICKVPSCQCQIWKKIEPILQLLYYFHSADCFNCEWTVIIYYQYYLLKQFWVFCKPRFGKCSQAVKQLNRQWATFLKWSCIDVYYLYY